MTVFEKIRAIAKVLKRHHPNLTTEVTLVIAEEILTALDDSPKNQG